MSGASTGVERRPWSLPAFVAWLVPRLRDADVVHAHMLGAWWAAATAAPDDVPLIASEHNGYAWRGATPRTR